MVATDTAPTAWDRIADHLEDGSATVHEIADATGVNQLTVRRVIHQARADGLVEIENRRSGHRRYRLVGRIAVPGVPDQPPVAPTPTPPAPSAPAEPTESVESELFDPRGHSVREVQAHLADADDAEKQRIVELERRSDSPRATILKLAG